LKLHLLEQRLRTTGELVFPGERRITSCRTPWRSRPKRAWKRVGVEAIGLHAARHTFVSPAHRCRREYQSGLGLCRAPDRWPSRSTATGTFCRPIRVPTQRSSTPSWRRLRSKPESFSVAGNPVTGGVFLWLDPGNSAIPSAQRRYILGHFRTARCERATRFPRRLRNAAPPRVSGSGVLGGVMRAEGSEYPFVCSIRSERIGAS
jgi:hypothetical protein